MMNRIKKFEIASFFFASVAGTLLHFLYEWTNKSPAAALISPVNESVFEHLKLTFFPLLIFAIFEYFFIGKKHNGFFYIKAKAVLLGILSVIVLYFTYSGIIGKNYMVCDIIIFYLSILIATVYFIKNYKTNAHSNLTGIIILVITTILFIVFTFATPHINLFFDMNGAYYGIKR